MLLNDFFNVIAMQKEGNIIRATLGLNKAHKIFDGHFPGLPVVPGVCMMQMVKEITESATGGKLQLTRADHLKFLVAIDPRATLSLYMLLSCSTMDDGSLDVSADLINGNTLCFKFKGSFLGRTGYPVNLR